MKRIDKVRFRDAVRIGPEELYYAFSGGLKEYDIQLLNEHFILLNDVYIPMTNVTQFTLSEVQRVSKRAA